MSDNILYVVGNNDIHL